MLTHKLSRFKDRMSLSQVTLEVTLEIAAARLSL